MDLAKLENEFGKRAIQYNGALNLITTRINNLLEFKTAEGKEIPCTVSHRLKTFRSTIEKITRKTEKDVEDIDIDDILENVRDIAGIRICVLFKRHIADLEAAIRKIPGMTIIKRKDYISEPKPNGYSSLHLIVQVEIYTDDGTELVPVEVQLRTKAQDLWAELEHYLYKNKGTFPEEFRNLFKQIAKWIDGIDRLGERIIKLIGRSHQK